MQRTAAAAQAPNRKAAAPPPAPPPALLAEAQALILPTLPAKWVAEFGDRLAEIFPGKKIVQSLIAQLVRKPLAGQIHPKTSP